MTGSERKEEWLRLVNVAHLRLNALHAIQKADGDKMLSDVLKVLKLGTPLELINWLGESDSK